MARTQECGGCVTWSSITVLACHRWSSHCLPLAADVGPIRAFGLGGKPITTLVSVGTLGDIDCLLRADGTRTGDAVTVRVASPHRADQQRRIGLPSSSHTFPRHVYEFDVFTVQCP